MFNELTSLIESQYERINLDNKFEYLTCAQLLHQTSPLAERILAEAAESLSPNGNFIIDQHNQNPQVTNSDLNSSEHRNVLLLLATRPYTPLA
jgi:ubiquinone/menaquinone biosynthesis C-methylase UbiE